MDEQWQSRDLKSGHLRRLLREEGFSRTYERERLRRKALDDAAFAKYCKQQEHEEHDVWSTPQYAAKHRAQEGGGRC